MGRAAISAEGLGKKYFLRHQGNAPYVTLRETIVALTKRSAALVRGGAPPVAAREEFWALRDLSFEVQEGEVLGIIGKNGSGKSTLLKIISRVTEPTTGRASVTGRVASLLEVGTGFHNELTGRENIFLNGAILGMKKAEIRRQFDAIVAFSGVEEFLDTPVKHYSSGMHMRLAFSVAAHLEAEILLIDEVLAVGDAEFQRRCMGKMEQVAKGGRTILFVSHNMNAVQELCTRAILLDHGRLRQDDSDVSAVTHAYLFRSPDDISSAAWVNPGDRYVNPYFLPRQFRIVDGTGETAQMPVRNDAQLWFELEADIEQLDSALNVGYGIFTERGELLYWACHKDARESAWPEVSPGRCVLRSPVPARLLNEGTYRVDLLVALHFRAWICEPGVNAPSIVLTIQGGLSDSPLWFQRRPGILAPITAWTICR